MVKRHGELNARTVRHGTSPKMKMGMMGRTLQQTIALLLWRFEREDELAWNPISNAIDGEESSIDQPAIAFSFLATKKFRKRLGQPFLSRRPAQTCGDRIHRNLVACEAGPYEDGMDHPDEYWNHYQDTPSDTP